MSQGAEEVALVQEVKDKKQLKKERKEKERQQKEKEKQEKARKKQEEKERKKQKKANDTESKQASKEVTEASGKSSRPEAVSVVEPPSQITAFGQPIKIAFSTENAGQGPLSASCKGAKIGDVMTEVTKPNERLCSVQFTPNEADIYTLNVQWGGTEVAGSPFQINLSRLSPAAKEVEAHKRKEKDVKSPQKVGENESKGQERQIEKQENDQYFASDDPFNMAYNASRLLGKFLLTA